MATLRKEQIAEIVLRGGSVIWNGNVITRLEEIPSAIDLAGDDLQHRSIAVAELTAQKAALEKELAALSAAPEPVKEQEEEKEPEKEPEKPSIPPAPSADDVKAKNK